MKRLIALLVLAAVALVPGAASAKSRTKVYRGTFQFVGADGAYVKGKFGRAQLVDGRRNDKLGVHVRRLASRAKYLYRLEQSEETACDRDAPAGSEVLGWTYRRGGILTTNRNGVANGSARSTTFQADPEREYFVGVYSLTPAGEPDELVLCAALHRKGGKGHSKSDAKAKAKHKARHGDSRGKAKAKGKDKAKPKPKPHDKPKPDDKGSANGQANANGQGNGDDHGNGNSQGQGNANGHDKDKANGNANGHGKAKPAASRRARSRR